MKHGTNFTADAQPFEDAFGVGQEKVARIRLEMAQRNMAKAAPDAFCVGYVNPEWRAMQRRLFASARADYERAKAVLS